MLTIIVNLENIESRWTISLIFKIQYILIKIHFNLRLIIISAYNHIFTTQWNKENNMQAVFSKLSRKRLKKKGKKHYLLSFI